MKNLYRRYKISQLLDEPLLDNEKEIVEFVLDKIKDLTIFIDGSNRDNYMNSKGELVFEYDEKNYRIYVKNEGFWSVLVKKYSLNAYNIQDILHDIICKNYKINVEKTYNIRSFYY
jgi:hypothetical protein